MVSRLSFETDSSFDMEQPHQNQRRSRIEPRDLNRWVNSPIQEWSPSKESSRSRLTSPLSIASYSSDTMLVNEDKNKSTSRVRKLVSGLFRVVANHLSAFYFRMDPIKDCKTLEETAVVDDADQR